MPEEYRKSSRPLGAGGIDGPLARGVATAAAGGGNTVLSGMRRMAAGRSSAHRRRSGAAAVAPKRWPNRVPGTLGAPKMREK